jgi:hypothetical protein
MFLVWMEIMLLAFNTGTAFATEYGRISVGMEH